MQKLAIGVILVAAILAPAYAQAKGNPLVGRWDFNIPTTENYRAAWLGITEKGGALEVWYQPTGGNVYEVKDVKADGAHLTLVLSPAAGNRPATTWELDAAGDKLTGVQKQGEKTMNLAGVRAPELNRKEPK